MGHFARTGIAVVWLAPMTPAIIILSFLVSLACGAANGDPNELYNR